MASKKERLGLREWSEKCKWFGKFELYKRWKPLVEDFYKTFILKRDLNKHFRLQIDILINVKNAHKEDYAIRGFCNEHIKGFRAHLDSYERVGGQDKYPNLDDVEIYLFLEFGNPDIHEGDHPFLPDVKKFSKAYRNQTIKAYVTSKDETLINDTILRLADVYNSTKTSELVYLLSNGLCDYESQYIARKLKTLRTSSS